MINKKMLHKFDYRKNLEELADELWDKYNDENNWTGAGVVHERMSIIGFGTKQQEVLQKGQRTYLEEKNQKKLQNPHLNLNIQMRKTYYATLQSDTDDIQTPDVLCQLLTTMSKNITSGEVCA